jgi:hypothetical protein
MEISQKKPPCLVLDFRHGVEPQPHPSYLSGQEYICPRCGRSFSDPHPTAQNLDRCVFDPTSDNA